MPKIIFQPLMITNPAERLADSRCKSGGTPGGLKVQIRRDTWRKTFAERTATIHRLEIFN